MYSSLLILINNGLHEEKDFAWLESNETLVFSSLLIVSFLCRRYFQNHLIRFTNNALYDFELLLLDKVRFATYESFKQLGVQKVYTAIDDTKTVAQLPRFFVDASNNAVLVICGFAYMLYTSPISMAVTGVITGSLAILYWWRNKAIAKDLNILRNMENDFYRYLQDLLHGFREIKMSISKNDNLYHKHLEENRMTAKRLEIDTSIKYLDNELFGSYSWYVILGVVIFILPQWQIIGYEQLTTFVVVILYLMGPLSFLINTFPFVTRMQIAFNRLGLFNKELSLVAGQKSFGKPLEDTEIKEIRFEDVCYTYKNKKLNRSFTLGPLNLTINSGETIFVIGENGSGKSTFMLLLAGLVKPDKGSIYLNDQLIHAENLPQYSNLLSSILSDPHFFSEQYEHYEEGNFNYQWDKFTKMMQLNGVVEIDESKRLADSNLSKGQQKRLLMIYSLMENKQVILLDEWAAEQDPHFRSIFYNEILNHMRSRNKTVVAITHDDRYYHYADRRITFHDGLLIGDEMIKQPENLTL
jgi:cyclic peptide transporter